MRIENCRGLRCDKAHHPMHKLWWRPWRSQCKEGMPMIGHDNERTQINAVLPNREFQGGDYDFAAYFIENRLLWKKGFRDEEGCRPVDHAIRAKVLRVRF